MTTKQMYKGVYNQKELDEISDDYRVLVKIVSPFVKSKFDVGNVVILIGRSSPKVAFYKHKKAIVRKVINVKAMRSGFVDKVNGYKEVYMTSLDDIKYTVEVTDGMSCNTRIILDVYESDVKECVSF